MGRTLTLKQDNSRFFINQFHLSLLLPLKNKQNDMERGTSIETEQGT